jgi:hypothetical protein
MKQGVAASPDNLPAQAAALVAARDARGLFELVRDRISTSPILNSNFNGYNGQIERLLWGPQATLRSGAGSPRDKVELLRDLLAQAGFEASVVSTSYQPTEGEVAAHFARKELPAFEMKADPERLNAWADHVGVPRGQLPTEGVPAIDPTGAEATALADSLLAQIQIPEDAANPSLVWYSPTPAVQVTVDGQPVVLQPLRPGASFGEALGEVEGPAPEATSEQVKVFFEGYWSDTQSWEPMVQGQWQEHQLAGRQLLFSAMPTVPTETFLQSSLDDLDTFVPLLGVQAPDRPSDPFSKDLTFAGDAFSLGGEAITVDEGGTVRVDGVPILLPGQVGPAEQVAAVEVLASGLQFPKVRLRVRALDAQGKPVLGLGPAAFAVQEQGRRRPTLVRANQASRRVLVLIDASLSMPDEFRDAAAEAMLTGIREDLLALDPDMEIVTSFTGSDLWTSLSSEGKINPGAIVFITDGDTTDAKTPAIEAALKVSPKAYLINVVEELNPELTEMAQLTGGAVASVKTPAEARAKAVEFLKDTPAPDYVLTYEAPLQGETTRQVAVTVNQKVGQGSYTVPALEERVPSRRLIGLRMFVEMGGQGVYRQLFGYEGGAIEAADVEKWNDQMRANLRSTIALSFEGERPLEAVLAGQTLDMLTSLRPSLDAALAGDRKKALDGLNKGMQWASGMGTMRARLPASLASQVAVAGLRATLHQERFERVGPEELRVQSTVDIFSIFRHQGVGGASAAEAFRATARATAHTALLEASLFPESTLALLKGKKLTMIAPFEPYTLPASMEEATRVRLERLLSSNTFHFRFYAEDGSTGALWILHGSTGELLGLLEDGSGGTKDIQQSLLLAKTVAAILGGIAKKMQMTGLALVAVYGAFLASLYGAVAIVIDNMDAGTLDNEIKKAVISAVLGTLGVLLQGPFGIFWSVYSLLVNTLVSAIEQQ